MQEIIEFLRNIRQDSTINIVEVSFCGAASPEGSDQLNRKLARGRLTALENLVRQQVDIPDSIITHNDNYIPWEFLKSQIEDSELVYKMKCLPYWKKSLCWLIIIIQTYTLIIAS